MRHARVFDKDWKPGLSVAQLDKQSKDGRGAVNMMDPAGGKMILAGGNIILAGGKIILAGGKIILPGGKIILAGGEIILAGEKRENYYYLPSERSESVRSFLLPD